MPQRPGLQANPAPVSLFVLLQTSSQGNLSDHGSSDTSTALSPLSWGSTSTSLRQKSLPSWGPRTPKAYGLGLWPGMGLDLVCESRGQPARARLPLWGLQSALGPSPSSDTDSTGEGQRAFWEGR